MDLLLVENDRADEALVLGMFARAPRALGFRVRRARNLLEADAITRTASAGELAVVLDLSLADSSEEMTLSWIEKNALGWPVVVLTGNDENEVPERALRAGAQDYLVKWDFNAHALARAIWYAIERHRIHQELHLAKDAAEAANRAKSEFLANMSHEIRTPLTAMLGLAELLAESSLSDEQRRYVDVLGKAGDHLRVLIDQVLDLAKIDAGGIVLERIEFSLADLLGGVTDMFRARAEAKGVALACHVPNDRPFVLGDPTRLKQVLINLVGNALKFTERGQVTLAAEPNDDDHFTFAVTDTGIGIAPAHQGLIFGAFVQADASTTRLHGGSGLGLAIARRLVRRMDGEIALESTVGRGSTFRFSLSLPRAPGHPVVPAAGAPEAGAWQVLSREPRRSWQPVVIADDAPENRLLFEAFLRSAPFETVFANDGVEVLDLYRRLAPALMLLDLHMPRMDGIAAARCIRQIEQAERRPPVPLIAFTADAFAETRQACLAAGFTGFLVKPTSKPALRDAIARALLSVGPAPDATDGVTLDGNLRALLPQYVANRDADFARIQLALRAGDLSVIEDIGHRMKGSGCSYGLPWISEIGARIETAARERRSDLIQIHLRDLERGLATAHQQITY